MMVIAAWDASTTAILVGIAVGILGSVGTAGAALYTKFSAAGLKATQDWLAMETQSLRERNQACEERNNRLEARVDTLEERASKAERDASNWQLKWQIATGNLPTQSLPPKNENG
jgi:hypothetical protein